MAEEHHAKDYVPVSSSNKEQKYKNVLMSFQSLIDVNDHPLSTTSNLLAVLKEQFNWWWIGYYFLTKFKNEEILTLGQFQGPIACTKLFKGKGVCGTSWEKQQVVIVENVEKFPGHIACSSASKSEIVLPICHEGKVIGVLDIDSQKFSQFNEIDAKYLNELIGIVSKLNHFEWFAKNM